MTDNSTVRDLPDHMASSVETSTRPPKALPGREEPEANRLSLLPLSLLALIVGVITGVGAVVFRGLIGLVHNVMFLGHFDFAYNASLFTPASPWGPWVILVPVIGGMGVTWIVSNFAPEAKGHGVPEVMDAIYYKRGIIRPVVALVKSIASALAIGSGSAVGREGPIIQIGSALGSTLGQMIRMQAGQRITLVAAGAGAGIAATFNTPIGGVLFATELMLPEISVNTFLPVAVATGTATFIGRLFFGSQPAFSVPTSLAAIPNEPSSVLTLALYALLGAFIGLSAACFIRGLHWVEDGFDRIPGRYTRHALGMLVVGIMMYILWLTAGHYYTEGVGYSTIQATLYGHITSAPFLILLCVCKLLATSISLGSGSSGGVFSPSLYIGATLGAAFASIVTMLFPGAPVSLPAFAMVGMGAMVGGGTGAAMTAVTMIFEMTRDYNIVLPMILAVALALGVRRMVSRENLYTLKLVRRGHPIPKALHANMFLVHSAADIMERDLLVLEETVPFATFAAMAASQGGLQHVVVTREGVIVGGLHVGVDLRLALQTTPPDVTLKELMQKSFTIVRETNVAFDVITMMGRKHASMAIVISQVHDHEPQRVLGVITKEHVADTVMRSIEIYPS
ncbi:chloride channel protein [Acidisoma cladoniae]|uniref:chloride channel protein n=1 Tax=Acidisoma cladoniae TaxID=3040935 RepID=UPI002550E0CD|nr:chloride channel protein [Acidisoma sp. PAMC 29798]